jgi:hypothetical protein
MPKASMIISQMLSSQKSGMHIANKLVVGLSSWVIQDGNYRDFARGTNSAFALEFYASPPLEEFEPASAIAPSLTYIADASYEVIGQVVHVATDWWVIDVGILAFQEATLPTNLRQGSWFRGRIQIGIDPFFYFQRLARQPSAPALIYDWRIERIEVQTAPLIEVRPRVMERDPTKLGWKEIVETSAWEDEGEYLLYCHRLDSPTRRTRRP